MKRRSLHRNRAAMAVCGFAVVEWVLFEFVRTPYRPPQDMTTLLGTEKYAVITGMLVLALFGSGLFLWWILRSTWTRRDVATIAILVIVLIVAGSIVIVAPPWSVTPFQLLLR
ncbi:MAG: hypothetical protein IT445_06955 [Phycisphaeraceae bacterium]|nr:hypothetical protein [Phycisphaeraceae bacterium]